MLNLTLKGLWAHKLRFLLTGLAVTLGVAFMSGTMILTDTMSQTFDELLAENNDGIDAVVQGPTALEAAATGDVRERVDPGTLEEILAVDGVDTAAGSVQGFAQLVRADGEVNVNALGATIGTNWIDDARLNPFHMATGEVPGGAREAVVDAATVDEEGWLLGDTFTVLGKDGPVDLTLVGAATYGDVKGIPGSTMIATDVATAQEMFGEPGRFDSIVVTAEAGVMPAELARRLQESLGGDVEVLTGAADTAVKQSELREDLGFFNKFLLTFAYISLFVGMFIIYNTFSILIAQRTRDLAMLRAIGAGRAHVLRSVLVEAVAVAVVAVAAGLALGVGMSFGLRALLSQVGLDIPSGAIVISSTTIVTSTMVGVAVTLVSSLAPALRASRVAPLAALRDIAIDRTHLSVRRVLAGLGVTGAGVGTTAIGMNRSGSTALQLLGLGAVVTVLGVFVLGPVLARPILRIVGAPARRLSGTVGHLARENARRNPKRTSATAAALMVGVGLVGFITILASSSTAAVTDQVDRSFRADYVVDSGQFGEGGLSPQLAAELTELPEIATTSSLRVAPVVVDGKSTQLAGVDTSVFDELYDIAPVRGATADVTGGAVAVEVDRAAELGIDVGDTVTMTFSRTGTVGLRVAAVFEEQVAGTGATTWITDLSTYEANVTDQYDRQVFLAAAAGVDAATSRAAIDDVLADWPAGELQDQAGLKESITSEINRMLNLIYGLLALAVIIALIGIANTLALSVHERTRELGLLRAVGMERRQVRTLVRWESVMIAVLGTGLGLVLALGAAWAIVRALADEGITTVVVPAGRMTAIIAVAIIAGVAAAAGPARRAARLNILKAVAID